MNASHVQNNINMHNNNNNKIMTVLCKQSHIFKKSLTRRCQSNWTPATCQSKSLPHHCSFTSRIITVSTVWRRLKATNQIRPSKNNKRACKI